MAKIVVRDVTKRFVEGRTGAVVTAIEDINFSIDEGQFVCLVGPSGCGKSTMLNILAGLENPSSGTVILNGNPVVGTGPDRIMVFQENALFPWLRVIENVEFGLKMAGVDKAKRYEIAIRYLDMMQLTKFAQSYIYQLSGGMKQRVAIARALVMDPEGTTDGRTIRGLGFSDPRFTIGRVTADLGKDQENDCFCDSQHS